MKCKHCFEKVPKWQSSKDYCSLKCELESAEMEQEARFVNAVEDDLSNKAIKPVKW